jgi:FkbM family methyltransferase
MLLSFASLTRKYRPVITGILHIGAHHGQEVKDYLGYGIPNIVLIEPCAAAFRVLSENFGKNPLITLLNFACGTYTGEASMFTETANQGQSNSILKPANHTKHYPDIKFGGTELVQLRPLDSLVFREPVNFLNMDVQGAEAHVLRGGQRVLSGIEYVYTEVNQDGADLYEGAVGISELDRILHEFKRVETKWVENHGWGDAFYIRRSRL